MDEKQALEFEVRKANEAEAIHFRLVHAVTEYDRKQSTKKSYNRYALGMYLQAVQSVESWLGEDSRHTLRQAIVRYFNGRLMDACLAAIGEPKGTLQEHRS